jgi:hypothetical protein
MSTIEKVVKEDEHKGKGDNFIVEWWTSHDGVSPPVIQAIISDASNGIFFK